MLQIFKTMEKSEFHVLLKHCFMMWGKILFKQSNGLINVIWILLHWKQWLRSAMLTLNVVVQTQMILNARVTQIRQLSWKTWNNSMNSFWPIINWSNHYIYKHHSISPGICIYIYIYINSHPQIDCFIVSQLFSVARYIYIWKLFRFHFN